MNYNVEDIYDAQINPLMAKIISICKANKIPMVALYLIKEDMICSTSLNGKKVDSPDADFIKNMQKQIESHYEPAWSFSMMITEKKEKT